MRRLILLFPSLSPFTNKGDALASRVQNTLGSYEEMKDLLTSHSNQSHLVGIPKVSSTPNNLPTPTSSGATPTPPPYTTMPERPGFESQQLFHDGLRGGTGVGGGGGGEVGGGGVGVGVTGERRMGNCSASSSSIPSVQQPPSSLSSSLLSGSTATPHQTSKKSRGSSEWSRGGHGVGNQGTGLVLGLGAGQGGGSRSGRGKLSSLEEQQIQRHEDLFSSLTDELGLKGDLSPSSSSSSSSSSSGRRHSSHPSKSLTLPDRPSTMEGSHFKSSSTTESNGHFKSSPIENEPGSYLSSSSPLASTSVLTTPTPGLTTPTSGLTTPTFPPGNLSGKPIAVQQKPTAYVRPMDGQDQAPSDSPQLKPPLVATEGYSNSQAYGGNSVNVKNKLPKLNLSHTGEVSLPNDSSCVEEILREMTHSWPPPLTAIHTPGKSEQTKFPIPNKEPQHVPSPYSTQKRCAASASKPVAKPPAAPQKSMLEDDLKISSDEEDTEQQVSDKPKARSTALSGASGSSSESESSSESDTDESESSSTDSDFNPASRTNTPEPEPPSTNKWQLDSWLNKVQPQTKPLVPPQQAHHEAGSIARGPETFSPGGDAPGGGGAAKAKPSAATSTTATPAQTGEHKDTRGAFCTGREKGKTKLSQKGSGEGQRSKMRLSPGLLSGSEVTTPRRNTVGKNQPRRTERANSLEDHQNQAWSRTNQHSPTARDKDLLPPPTAEHQNPSRPRSKPSGGKALPRKEHRGTTYSSNAVTPPSATQQAPITVSTDKKKHRGPSSKITPKSREFIETESSSSSSECHSDPEEVVKIPALLSQMARAAAAINSQTLSNALVHAPLLPCLGPGGAGSLGTFGGKGLRLKDGSNVTSNGSSSNGSSSSNSSTFNSLSITNVSSSFGNSVPDPGGLEEQCRDLDSMSLPSELGKELPLSPLRDYQEIQSLWVKIELSLLSRVPGQGLGERDRAEPLAGKAEKGESGGKHRRQTAGNAAVPTEKHTAKSKRKHKTDHSEASLSGSKKLRLDKDCQLLPPCISPIHTHKSSSVDSLNRKQSRRRSEKLLPPLLSPLSDDPPHKRTCDTGSSLSHDSCATSMVSCASSSSCSSAMPSSSSYRHRKGEGKASSHGKTSSSMDAHSNKPAGDSYHANRHSDSETWSEPMMEPVEPRRPRLSFNDTVYGADHHMQEAKRLKHKADALMDKFGKAVNYADGALSFIECGNAMERDPLEAKSPYTMYSETVELIRYAMRLKNFTAHSATVPEKKLAVLCNHCLSLLYLRMFRLKKDHAVKYSRSLMEYFKNSAKSSHQAPSPWRANGKVNGTPSPASLSPSPAGSGAGSGGPPASSGSVAIPQRIHHMAASHVNITNNILRSYEHWETAERLATDSQEFFQELDSVMEPLSQQSSMTELVRYVRQGLHWLRIEAHLL
ncbi:AF4/FMR2 family member 2 [Lampris incognitus]|uniref:AF4/FMR2 family member 2 n=1 Tax=Lampris incognitus TaxID=2546036 RepID=UPI0024B547FB|nr:AF4/FMR2 family member 2 [Lampris incognitus]